MPGPLLTLSSDFGSASAFAAMWRGALLARCPEARLLDLSHDLAGVFGAALLLLRVYSYYPARTLHLLAWDRGDGPDRVLIASAAGQFFLALDHGGLGLVLERDLMEREQIEREPKARVWAVPLRPRTTFVARDAFPELVAALVRDPAHPPGEPVSDWQRLALPRPTPVPGSPGEVMAEVLWVDEFGNLVLNVPHGDWRQAEVAGVRVPRRHGHYGNLPAGEMGLLEGAEGWMEIVLPGDSAALQLHAGRGTPVRLR